MPEKYRIEWAPVAVLDLDEILEYISAQDGSDAAIRAYSKISEGVDTLTSHPLRCRIVPELRNIGVLEYRELPVPPHRVFFRIEAKVVSIVGVLDGRRDLEEVLIDRVLETT